MKLRKCLSSIAIIAFVALLTSCQYEFIEEPPIIEPDPEEEISFSSEIAPIFSTDNNCTACHKTGGTSPDLTPENAYASLSGDALIEAGEPSLSVIYYFVKDDADTHVWKQYTSSEAELVKLWITQGAKNN